MHGSVTAWESRPTGRGAWLGLRVATCVIWALSGPCLGPWVCWQSIVRACQADTSLACMPWRGWKRARFVRALPYVNTVLR